MARRTFYITVENWEPTDEELDTIIKHLEEANQKNANCDED